MKEIKRIVLGSTSPHKHRALVQAATHVCQGELPQIVAYDVATGVRMQPCGDEETITGALGRMFNARKKDLETVDPLETLYVGIESGVREVRIDIGGHVVHRAFGMGYVVGVFGLAMDWMVVGTLAVEFPLHIYQAAEKRGFDRCTVGMIVADYYGGKHTDPHELLTMGVVKRTQTFVEAIDTLIRLVRMS